jgi:pimeloyl-ACP methyl ester carboxylesterase
MVPSSSATAQAQTPRPSFQDHYAEVNGVRLHYASIGQGPLVLFLHGYPSFWASGRIRWPRWGAITLAVGLDMRG